jgi:hypothetical protein
MLGSGLTWESAQMSSSAKVDSFRYSISRHESAVDGQRDSGDVGDVSDVRGEIGGEEEHRARTVLENPHA